MNRGHMLPILFFLPIALMGCIGDKAATSPAAASKRTDAIIGKWKLVRAGEKPPADLNIQSQLIEIMANGTWTSKIEFQIPGFGRPDTFNANGTWTLTADELSLQNTPSGGITVGGGGADLRTGRVRMESGHLFVDPDPFMQVKKKGTGPTAGEYERAR